MHRLSTEDHIRTKKLMTRRTIFHKQQIFDARTLSTRKKIYFDFLSTSQLSDYNLSGRLDTLREDVTKDSTTPKVNKNNNNFKQSIVKFRTSMFELCS